MNQNLTKYISVPRLEAYSDFDEYKTNIQYCKRCYVYLNILEVALRNAINDFACSVFGDNWLTTKSLDRFKRSQVDSILEKDSQATNDIIVSRLHFSFWCSMFDKYTKGNLALRDKNLKSIFQGIPDDMSVSDIRNKLDRVRRFRNRVYHYEKVINTKYFTIENDILDIVRYIDSSLLELVSELK